jgi:hypothetical protein
MPAICAAANTPPSNRNISPPSHGGRGDTQSTQSSPPSGGTNPISSPSSRLHADRGDSPGSNDPPGSSHLSL